MDRPPLLQRLIVWTFVIAVPWVPGGVTLIMPLSGPPNRWLRSLATAIAQVRPTTSETHDLSDYKAHIGDNPTSDIKASRHQAATGVGTRFRH